MSYDAKSSRLGADPVLRQSDSGDAVIELQELLNAHGSHLSINGKFGSAVLTAVVSFQQRNGLQLDGIVGPQVWAALRGRLRR